MIGGVIVQLVVFGLIVYGMSQIISEASIMKPVRNFFSESDNRFMSWVGTGISCFLCISVWVSFLISWHVFSPSLVVYPYIKAPAIFSIGEIEIVYTKAKILFIDGMIGSAIAWLYRSVEEFLT